MNGGALLVRARKESGLSQEEVARRAHTSRPTLSAYEHGRKSPTMETAQRVLDSLGFELVAQPKLEFVGHPSSRGPIPVPSALPRLAPREALAAVRLPLHLNWSDLERTYHLADRRQRARVYEIVLREGGPDDIATYIDGLLLVDLWEELVLPRQIRAAWEGLVRSALHNA